MPRVRLKNKILYLATVFFFLCQLTKAFAQTDLPEKEVVETEEQIQASAFRIPCRTFLIYQPNAKLTLILGVAGFPDYETKVVPIVGFIYKPNDRLAFNIVPSRPTVSHKLNDKFTFFGEADFSYGEYEVTKDDLENVVLQYEESHIGLGLS